MIGRYLTSCALALATFSVVMAAMPARAADVAAGSVGPIQPTPRVLVVARGLPVTASGGGDVETIITQAAFEFGQDPSRMLAVARCESGLNPDAIGDSGMAIGLWQFHSPTFADYARRSGLGYSLRDIGDPVAQSRVAGWAWRDGRAAAWTCYR